MVGPTRTARARSRSREPTAQSRLQRVEDMPKQKTSSSAKKRFKLTGSGRVLHRHGMQSHNLSKKSEKRKRDFANDQAVAPVDVPMVKKLLGRG